MSNERALMTMDDMKQMSQAFAKSGYFKDACDAAQAFVKIQAGRELGLEPFFSMSNVHIIQGKPTLGAGAISAKVKGSGKYDYKVVRLDDGGCQVDFYEQANGQRVKIGESVFTVEDAQRAQLTKNPTWAKFPRNMMFARAMSNGARWYTPDIFGGSVYTPDELGGEFVDADYSVQPQAPTVTVEEPEPTGSDQTIPDAWLAAFPKYTAEQLTTRTLNFLGGFGIADLAEAAERLGVERFQDYEGTMNDFMAAINAAVA